MNKFYIIIITIILNYLFNIHAIANIKPNIHSVLICDKYFCFIHIKGIRANAAIRYIHLLPFEKNMLKQSVLNVMKQKMNKYIETLSKSIPQNAPLSYRKKVTDRMKNFARKKLEIFWKNFVRTIKKSISSRDLYRLCKIEKKQYGFYTHLIRQKNCLAVEKVFGVIIIKKPKFKF